MVRGLADAVHNVVITNLYANAFAIDAIVVVSGAKLQPVAGLLMTMGDSWTTGVGAFDAANGYPARLAALVAAGLKRNFSLLNKGVNGTGVFCTTASTLRSGLLARALLDIFPALPEVITILFGANDLRIATQNGSLSISGGMGVAAGDVVGALRSLCCLLEDVLDVSNAAKSATPFRVVLATPGQLASSQTFYRLMLSGAVGYPAGGIEQWEIAATGIRNLALQFPWLRIADVYNAMDGKVSLVFPNGYADQGLHPNDDGHAVIAQEIAQAALQ